MTATPPAFAALYCITDEDELRAALATVSSTFESAPNELRLAQGIYFNGFFRFDAQLSGSTGDFAMSGGWTTAGDTPCDVQEVDARTTVLDAQHVSAVLRIGRNVISGEISPSIAISNLTIRNGSAENAPVGLEVRNSFGSITVDNVIVHGHRATNSQFLPGVAATLDSTSDDIRLRNSLFYDNEGVFLTIFSLADVLLTSLSLNADRNWYVTNNTIVQDPDHDSEALRIESDGNFWVTNNAVQGGVRYAASITGAGAATPPQVRQLYNNFSAPPSLGFGAVLAADLFNGTAAPHFEPVTFAPGDGSPLFDAALGSPPGGVPAFDVYGAPRVFNDLPDIGAVEAQRVVPEPGAIASILAALGALTGLRRARG